MILNETHFNKENDKKKLPQNVSLNKNKERDFSEVSINNVILTLIDI